MWVQLGRSVGTFDSTWNREISTFRRLTVGKKTQEGASGFFSSLFSPSKTHQKSKVSAFF